MDIPENAEVKCSDGPCGRTTYVVLNSSTDEMTHLVVQEREPPHRERLVPIELVVESTPHLIHLSCTKLEFTRLKPFKVTESIRSEVPHYIIGPYMDRPYVMPETRVETKTYESIPPGELAVRHGAAVEATDGQVGKVDEFLVDPTNGHITHLILREGHLWGQKDVSIPVSLIDHILEEAVYLKIDKHSVQILPAIPVRRG